MNNQKLGPLQQDWVNKLRSGKYLQGTYTLRSSEEEYCCLGVLESCHNNKIEKEDNIYSYFDVIDNCYYANTLTNQTRQLLKIEDLYVSELALMNDSGMSFIEIADYIEQNAKDIFKEPV